jgi:hypothetical protein
LEHFSFSNGILSPRQPINKPWLTLQGESLKAIPKYLRIDGFRDFQLSPGAM